MQFAVERINETQGGIVIINNKKLIDEVKLPIAGLLSDKMASDVASENEIFKKFESKNIYVIGFSLGALVCYEYICSMNEPLGGIFPVSGFMRNNDINLNPNQIKTPIIIGHGENDTVVPLEKSIEAYKILKRKKANVQLIKYDAQHHIPIKMLTIISKIIKNKL